jgi:hypothetical protein
MIFNQYENGSCDILFSKEEIKIIKNNKKLHLSSESLKIFGDQLVGIVAIWYSKFDEKTKNQFTKSNSEIKTK